MILVQCNTDSHIDRYKVSIDSLLSLPTGFYGHRGNQVYVEDLKVIEYRVWMDVDDENDILNVSKLENFKSETNTSIDHLSPIDTSYAKLLGQRFVDLSKLFKFRHLLVAKNLKVSFSTKEDVQEEYVYPLSDSAKQSYQENKDFKTLGKGWFQNMNGDN